MSNWRASVPAAVVAGLGVGLLAVSAAHHSAEIGAIDHTQGPLSAFIVDTVPALAVVAAGWVLSRTDFSVRNKWRVAGWTVGGSALFAAVTLTTVVIREFEGRSVAEPQFPLLVSGGIGALAAFVAGYFEVVARRDADHAERTSHAFSFVNDVLRHDIRNSLGVVRGNAELIATETDRESVAERAGTIREQADEALGRIEDAGTIADTISGDAPLEAVDLAPIAATAAERAADAYDVTVTTDVPETARVRANDAVRSVVDNVVENAAEHNDADDPRVTVRVERVGDVVRLEVRDNGPGVPPSVLEDVEEGGLDLAATLVEHYDGTISVAENQPRGSVFTVVLPAADAD
ncbi:MAG: ATP-binding protein [Halobacterium sp.]